MKKVADTHHLFRRDGVWYYRRRVPRHLVEAYGREVVQFSLDTQSKAEAKRLREVRDVQFSAEFERVERERANPGATAGALASPSSSTSKRTILTAGLAGQLVREYVARLDQRQERRILEEGIADSKEQFVEVEANLEETIEMLTNPNDQRGDDQIGSAYLALHRQAGLPEPNYEATEHDLLWSYLRRGLVELGKRQLARWRDGYTKTPYDPLFGTDAPAQVTVAELAEKFLQLKEDEGKANGIKLKSLERHTAHITLIRRILGDSTPVQTIDYERVIQFRKTLSQIPTNLTKIYGALSLEQAIRQATKDEKPHLSALTQSQYLATFRELLSFGAKNQLIPHALTLDVKPLQRGKIARANLREPFTLQQLEPCPGGLNRLGLAIWLACDSLDGLVMEERHAFSPVGRSARACGRRD